MDSEFASGDFRPSENRKFLSNGGTMKWDAPAGRALLRAFERGTLRLASVARENAVPAQQVRLIATSLRWRRKHRRSKHLLDVRRWSKSVAQELDFLRVAELRRRLALEQFDRRGFRGNSEHLRILLESIGDRTKQSPWNRWRLRKPRVRPDLRGARLTGMDMRGLDLRSIRLAGGDLSGSLLRVCSVDGADLRRVTMRHTDLSHATLTFADLRDAVLEESLLVDVDFYHADLHRAALIGCLMNRANLSEVKLRDAVVWGLGGWDVSVDEKGQEFMVVIGGDFDPEDYDLRQARKPGQNLKVNNIELAHFISLISDNDKIGSLLRGAAERLVLLLGRFEGEQEGVLEALRGELPRYGYAPVVFDFEQDRGRDLVETVTTLAGLARFVIADLTSPRSTPLESHAIVPDIAIPFVPLVRGERPFSMFASLQRKYFWVLPTVCYRSERHLIRLLGTDIIAPAERKLKRLRALKNPAG